MEEINSESRCAVGLENRWTTVCFCGGSSDSFLSRLTEVLFLLSSSSIASSVCTITVHPGGIGEWCRSRFVDLNVKPPNTGVTVYICPSANRQNFVQHKHGSSGRRMKDRLTGQEYLLDHLTVQWSNHCRGGWCLEDDKSKARNTKKGFAIGRRSVPLCY